MGDRVARTKRGAIVQWLIDLCFTLAKAPFLRRAKRKVFWKLIQCEPDDNFNRKILLLCAPIEKVKVPKLEANPLSGLSDELVRTVQRLWVRSRVRRRKQLLATVPENRECEETIRGKDLIESS